MGYSTALWTNDLLNATHQEMMAADSSPTTSPGDFNTDSDSKLTTQVRWIDVATLRPQLDTTAKHVQRTPTKNATRRYFLFANDLAVIAINSFRNDKEADFDVHNPIRSHTRPQLSCPLSTARENQKLFRGESSEMKCNNSAPPRQRTANSKPTATSERLKEHELEKHFASHYLKARGRDGASHQCRKTGRFQGHLVWSCGRRHDRSDGSHTAFEDHKGGRH